MVPENMHAIFVLARSYVLTNAIVSQEDTTGRGEKLQHFWPTSVYRKARKIIRKERKKTKSPHAVCQPLPTPEEPDLCNNFISKEPDYIDCFVLTFLDTASSDTLF